MLLWKKQKRCDCERVHSTGSWRWAQVYGSSLLSQYILPFIVWKNLACEDCSVFFKVAVPLTQTSSCLGFFFFWFWVGVFCVCVYADKGRFLPSLAPSQSFCAFCQLPLDSCLQWLCRSHSGEQEGSAWLLIKWGSVSSGSKSSPILCFSKSLAKSNAKFTSLASRAAKAETSFLYITAVIGCCKGKDVQNISLGKSWMTHDF